MSADVTIQKVLATNLLTSDLVVVPDVGATNEQLSALASRGIHPSPALERVLRRWDGIDLDVIRIHDVMRIMQNEAEGYCLFGSDPSGFLYLEASDGSVVSFDTDGGGVTALAASFDEFIDDVVFGNRGAEFAGEEWLSELAAVGLADPSHLTVAEESASDSPNRIQSIETVELEDDDEDEDDDEGDEDDGRSVIAIMVALNIGDETAIRPFVAEVAKAVINQRMISPPETEMLLITVIGPRTSASFESAWKEALQKDQALFHVIKGLSVAEGVIGTVEGKVLAEFSLEPGP
jgi:hypothetical protein